jgi:hypothetical protein
MLSAAQLLVTLQHYDSVYTSPASSNRILLLASKASILEVCGWVEQAMDLLVNECALRCNLSQPRLNKVESFIRYTYGFQYEQHFEKMLISVIGFRELEKAESTIQGQVVALKGTLSHLTTLRNHFAHTHMDELNPAPPNLNPIPAPSTMIGHANSALFGLSAIEARLLTLGH